MKKTLLTLSLVAMALCAMAQEKPRENTYKRDGKTFVQTSAKKADTDRATAYTWRDSKGVEYPIFLHTYTKGDKVGRTTCYVIRTSKKSGKEYKYYLPDGEEIARQILAETNNR